MFIFIYSSFCRLGDKHKIQIISQNISLIFILFLNNNSFSSFSIIDLNDDDGCIDRDFIKVIGRVPGGGLQTPFDEIKNYKSWYWGSDPSSKENIQFEKTEHSKICEICNNSSLCNSDSDSNSNQNSKMGIRVRITNSYKLLFSSLSLCT